MLRTPVAVCAVNAPGEDFTELWTRHRVAGGSTPEAAARLIADGTLAAALGRGDTHVLMARVDNEAVGYLAYRDAPRTAFCEQPVLSIDQLFVLPSARRHGVAQALISALARVAERQGIAQLAAHVPAQDRDANRYFTRLGFASQTVRRVASVATLRSRLAKGSGTEAARSRRMTLRARRRIASEERPAS